MDRRVSAKPLRILVLSQRYPPFSVGGYENACYEVAESLRARGHRVSVLTSRFGGSDRRGARHVRRCLHRPEDSPSLLRHAIWEIQDRLRLRRALRQRPDIVYVWNLQQLFPGLHLELKGASSPVVFNIQDIWIPKHLAIARAHREAWLKRGRNGIQAALKRAVRWSLRRVFMSWPTQLGVQDIALRWVVFCSRFRADQHLRAGLPAGAHVVIPNGIDLRLFSGEPHAPQGPGLRLLYVGRLCQEKGVHVLVESVETLLRRGRKVSLTIQGVPVYPLEYGDELKRRVASQGLARQIEFRPPVPNQQLPRLYREHDVLVFPSIGDEGLPVALLEAMACGLAVVSTATGGSAEILVPNTNGLVFPPGDSGALTECLETLLATPGLCHNLGAAAQALVHQSYASDSVADQTERFFLELLRTYERG